MADKAGDTVVVKKTHWWKRKPVLLGVGVVVALVAGFILFKFVFAPQHPDEAALASLQKNLQVAMNNASAQSVVDLTTGIINGGAKGTFKVTNTQLSTYHLDRASSYLNLQQYKNAVSDYEQAIMLDSSNKLAALQGEVEARYKLGDRQQLITLYQQMIELSTNSQNPRRGSETAQYRANIQTLQQGGELQF